MSKTEAVGAFLGMMLLAAVVVFLETLAVMVLFGWLHEAEPVIPPIGFVGSFLVVLIGQIVTYKPAASRE
jgi:hypothetical protein